MGRVQSVQVLRFLAAAAVVVAHAYSGRASEVGAMGVDVFFVISGFIITRTARSRPQGFLAARAQRVLPLYFLVAVPWTLLSLRMGQPLDGRQLLATLALWPATDRFAMPYLWPGWSLCYEAMFYLAIWLTLRGLRPAWLLTGYLSALVLALFTHSAILDYLGSPLTLEFLAGVGLALWPVDNRKAGAVALVAGAAGILALVVFGAHGVDRLIDGSGAAILRPLAFGLPAALIVFGALQFSAVSPRLAVLPFLGDASYSIYLLHMPARFVLRGMLDLPSWVTLAGSIALGAAVYWWVERPMLAALRQAASTSFQPTTP